MKRMLQYVAPSVAVITQAAFPADVELLGQPRRADSSGTARRFASDSFDSIVRARSKPLLPTR